MKSREGGWEFERLRRAMTRYGWGSVCGRDGDTGSRFASAAFGGTADVTQDLNDGMMVTPPLPSLLLCANHTDRGFGRVELASGTGLLK